MAQPCNIGSVQLPCGCGASESSITPSDQLIINASHLACSHVCSNDIEVVRLWPRLDLSSSHVRLYTTTWESKQKMSGAPPSDEKAISISRDASFASASAENEGSPSSTAKETQRIMRKLDWELMPICSLLYLASFIDRTAIGEPYGIPGVWSAHADDREIQGMPKSLGSSPIFACPAIYTRSLLVSSLSYTLSWKCRPTWPCDASEPRSGFPLSSLSGESP